MSLASNFGVSVTLCLGLALSLGCATDHPKSDLNLVKENSYNSIVEEFTKKVQQYDGFYQRLEFRATLINSKVAHAQLDQRARLFEWTKENYEKEKGLLNAQLDKQIEIFLSFYVPDRKHDDLAKIKSVWNVFMDVNGKRVEGKVTRLKTAFTELQSFYPHHNRWSTPYRIVFPAPASAIENFEAQLTLTGPVGSAKVFFQPVTAPN